MKKSPLVSVIIVSYNTAEFTLKSVLSAYNSTGFKPGEIEVIVVDNGSTDDTVNRLGSELDNFRLIINTSNLGFGSANNQGAGIARGEYLLLLNSDAFLSPDTLRVLVDALAKDQKLVSVGPELRYPNGSLQPNAGYFPTPRRVMGWMWGLDKLPLIKWLFGEPYHIFDLKWYQTRRYPDWLMGACILLRKNEFLAVRGFDEHIFMYGEEVDLYMRLKTKFGGTVCFTPATQVIHQGSASTIKASASRLLSELQGIKYLYSKHYPHLLWFIHFVIYTGVVMRLAVFSLIPSRREAVIEYTKFRRLA